MLAFVRKSALALLAVAAFSVAPPARAQDINVDGSLGNYYQNLYLSTHWIPIVNRSIGRLTHSGRRVHAAPVWNISPSHAAVVNRMVAYVPPASRPACRAVLQKTLALYPGIVRVASRGEGVTLHPTSTTDAATLAGVLSYQYLIGRDLTQAQFLAERKSTERWFASHDLSSAQMQQSGETYAMAVCLMGALKAYEGNPQNKNPELTRRQLHQLVFNTFKTGYRSADYTKFAATNRGIVRVSR